MERFHPTRWSPRHCSPRERCPQDPAISCQALLGKCINVQQVRWDAPSSGQTAGQQLPASDRKNKLPSRLVVKEAEVTEEGAVDQAPLRCGGQIQPLIQCQPHQPTVEEFGFIPALSLGQTCINILSLFSTFPCLH